MIELKQGNLLEADAEALVNTVNTQGVMGKGVALQFKKAFPEMYEDYKKACEKGTVSIGKMHVFRQNSLMEPKYIINFPTKTDWREPSKIEYIKQGVQELINVIKTLEIHSIAIPPLGCGQGGLKWNDVYPVIQEASERLTNVQFIVFPPQKSPKADSIINRTIRPAMNPLRARVLNILSHYCILGYELTLLEIQKLLYFMQEAGEPLKLRFQKSTYGPYADNLRHVLHLFEGHFIKGFADGKNKPGTNIRLLPEALDEARETLQSEKTGQDDSNNRLNRVTNLIEGFESPYGMELLATVHWTAVHDKTAAKEEAAVTAVQHWNDRKRRVMKPEHIRVAWRRLEAQGWIR
jgi:O-acetyl-ADP-ribose deacetylase (regulator of RNase III)